MCDSITFLQLDGLESVLPHKGTPKSAGIDLFLTRLIKEDNGVRYYGTGLSVRVPDGMYALIYPRSSLSKHGYLLANSVGVIDNDYQGELIVALTRTHGSQETNLELPFKAVQLIVQRDFVNSRENPLSMRFMRASDYEEEKTQRGAGGFGSTN